MKWFRFYDEVLDDPKCQRLTPVMFRHWVNILCIANRSNQRGTLPAVEHIAFSLRLSEAKTTAVLNDLVTAGLLDRNGNETFSPHGWSSRQRVSDDVAQRVSKHRERNESEPLLKQKSNVTDTLPHARATEAETETEAEREETPKPPLDPKPGTSQAADAARLTPPADPPVDLAVTRTAKQQASDAAYARKQSLFEAWCRGIGLDPDSDEAGVGRDIAFRQLKSLVGQASPTPDEFEACTRYLAGQSWRDETPKVPTVINGYGGWVAKNRPAPEANRPEPADARRGLVAG